MEPAASRVMGWSRIESDLRRYEKANTQTHNTQTSHLRSFQLVMDTETSHPGFPRFSCPAPPKMISRKGRPSTPLTATATRSPAAAPSAAWWDCARPRPPAAPAAPPPASTWPAAPGRLLCCLQGVRVNGNHSSSKATLEAHSLSPQSFPFAPTCLTRTPRLTCVAGCCHRRPTAAQALADPHHWPRRGPVKVIGKLCRPALDGVAHLLAVGCRDQQLVHAACEGDLPEQQRHVLLQVVVHKVCCQVGEAANVQPGTCRTDTHQDKHRHKHRHTHTGMKRVYTCASAQLLMEFGVSAWWCAASVLLVLRPRLCQSMHSAGVSDMSRAYLFLLTP